MRLRQGVLLAEEVEPLAGRLRAALGLGEPYHDPGVGTFSLRNAVMALGDTFIEVVAPLDGTAPAARRLRRRGPGGYMLMVQADDVAAVRRCAAGLGVRIVWQADLPDISGTHLHPVDLGGTLLSVDEARPAQTWHWGGPAWTGRAPVCGPGRLLAATVAVADAGTVAGRWGALLGVEPVPGPDGSARLVLDGGHISFVHAGSGEEGVVGFEVAVASDLRAGRTHLDEGGVRFTLVDA